MVYKPFNKDVKPAHIILVDDGYLESAVQTISGYCKKHVYCDDGCRFNTLKYGCFLQDTTIPPCDWEMPGESEDE